MGNERKRCARAGALATHEQRTGNSSRTRLAARGNGKPSGLLDRSVGAALRPQSYVGRGPSGSRGHLAGDGAAASAGRAHRATNRHAISGPGRARRSRTMRALGGYLRATALDHQASRRALPRLARRENQTDARTDSRQPGVVSENPAAAGESSKANAGKRPRSDRRHRQTRPPPRGANAWRAT